jgi:L,D-transpeptidase catalytic domain
MRRHPAPSLAALVAAIAALSLCSTAVARTTHAKAGSTHVRAGSTHVRAGSTTAGTAATGTSGSTSTGTTGTTTPPAVAGKATLSLPDVFVVQGFPVTVPGRVAHVQGVVRPFVSGQWVVVKAYLGSKLIKTSRLRIKPGPGSHYGEFTESVSAKRAGAVVVKVTHARTPQMRGFFAQRRYGVLSTAVQYGSRGRLVQLVQQRLAALHFYMPQTGVFDQGTQLALNAYHRLLGWGEGRISLDARTITDLLNGVGKFVVRYPHQGRHAEGDLTHQVLALINGSQVDTIYPISSGKPSTPTILGSYQVYSRVPGYLPDGMYYSDFFIRGYAIHGYNPAPDYPASHGCMRLPIVDAISAFDWLALGDWVDVYYR